MFDMELIIDSFAGGGGASHGITAALGRCPDIAVNHDADAIAMHAANHPGTKHFLEDVWKVHPRQVTKGRPVGLLWASPDCKHFSRAKGSKPVEKGIRSLAWTVVRWAQQCSPRVIILENVREFEEWGPLLPCWACAACEWKGTEGQATLARGGRRRCPRCDSLRVRQTEASIPDPARKGLTFRRFVGRLRGLGYKVEHRTLNAADYGAPTHRRRLFLVARCDGAEIVWPEPTHGDPKKIADADLFTAPRKPWRTAAEIIDWSIPCPSIFTRKRPLADATMRRIAMGIKRYVLDNPKPFLVTINHGGDHFRGGPLDKPLGTVTGSRGQAVVTPYLIRGGQTNGNGKYTNAAGEPLTTVTSKAEHMLIAPTLIQSGYGERDGQAPRTLDINTPMGTAVAGGCKQALVAAFLAKHYGGQVGQHADAPLPTATVRSTQQQLVTATFIAKHYGDTGQRPGSMMDEPLSTVTACDHNALVAANMIHLNHGDKQWSGCDEPGRTITTGNHAFLVYSFLVKYFGTAIGQFVNDPLHTVTGKDRFGLVTVEIEGETFVIADIGMRMLTPRELARGQGFPDDYILTGSNTSQVARIGNSVPPVMAQVLVEANYCGEAVTCG